MIPQPVIQTIFNVSDGRYGLRYLKIVKSPTGPHYVLDVMFKRGLRLTANIVPGNSAKGIKEDLDFKLQSHRPGEYDTISPAIELVSDCAARALSDEHGTIIELKEAWEMALFRKLLKNIDPEADLEWDTVASELVQAFSLPKP